MSHKSHSDTTVWVKKLLGIYDIHGLVLHPTENYVLPINIGLKIKYISGRG